MKFTREQVELAVKAKGYRWFDRGNYNLNIVGIRNGDTNGKVTNKFEDWITLSYIDGSGKWQYHEYQATTDPGSHWTEKQLLNKNGVAILKEGQHKGSHMIGLHQGKYEALRQKAVLPVYRDNDKDDTYDLIEENIQEGIFGINIHRATSRKGGKSTQIDKWSAGCQVIAAYDDFEEFMTVVRKGRDAYSNSFTYTLINSNDIK